MKLRTKTWLVVVSAMAVMVVLMVAIGSQTFLRSFERLEHDQALRDADRVLALIHLQQEEIGRIARDYGEWIDTAQYARGEMPGYEEANWVASSLENLKVHAMLVFAPDGRFAGGVLRDPETSETDAPMPGFVAGFSGEVAMVLGDPRGATRVVGIKQVGPIPWIIACVPVVLPDGPSGPLGAMIVARQMGDDFIEKLHETAQLPLSVHYPLSGAPREEREFEFAATGRDGVTAVEAGENLVLHLEVHALDGRVAATIHLTLDRPIRQEAMNTVWLIVAQAAGIALLCGVLFHTLLGRAVVSRLERMHTTVRSVGQTHDLSARVPVRGDDEIADLGEALNGMLDALARSREERESAHRERQKLQDQLVQAQKMEALGDFAGGIAHDFNNCLTTITGWLSMVREDMPLGSENRENLDLALTSAQHASAVVKQLLVYSRQAEPSLQPVAMREILGSSLQLLRAALPKSIHLNVSTTGDDDVVLADATQIKQVVFNLAKNAADAIHPPGRITLSLEAVTAPVHGRPGSESLPPGRYAHLAVSDSGPGVKPELLGRIFEPFFTTKPAGKGTGLGLAVVRSVVLRHRGAVGVSSPPGEGATFHVYLPLHAEQVVTAAPESTPPAGCRVLVVDDDPAVLKVVARLVSNLGYNAVTATQGIEAWEMFMHADPQFDIVLTDLTMPQLGGMQLGERIFNSGRRAPVVLLSAYASTLDAEQLRRAGFADLLPKPIDSASLKTALARARGRAA